LLALRALAFLGERLADLLEALAFVERFLLVFLIAFLVVAMSVAPQMRVPACVSRLFPLGTLVGEAASSSTSHTRIGIDPRRIVCRRSLHRVGWPWPSSSFWPPGRPPKDSVRREILCDSRDACSITAGIEATIRARRQGEFR
jgi:hypothetical protein